MSEMVLQWTLVPTGVSGLVLYRTRVPSRTDPSKSYRVTAANGFPVSCTCLRYHFAIDELDVCSHIVLASESLPVEGI